MISDKNFSRRDFVRLATLGTAAAALPSWAPAAFATDTSGPETVAKELYRTLSDSQRQAICLPADSPLRTRINPNWDITKPTIGSDFYSPGQQELIREVFRGVTSEDGHERFLRQMDDDSGGIETYTIALFGQPDADTFEFAMTGRHLTVRCDGNRTDNVAFGGPLVYGHGEEEVAQNMFFYQTQHANEVFASLDSDQRMAALQPTAPNERDVLVQGADGRFAGLRVGDMKADQKAVFETTLRTLLAPYREADVEEAMSVLKSTGGMDELRMAFYREDDLEDDGVWDMWRIEGPSFVCHFRGAPHVHAYLNVAAKA